MVTGAHRSPATAPGPATGFTILVLVAAVFAISSSALLVRYAAASAVALAFWRTAGGSLILLGAQTTAQVRPSAAQWPRIAVAGIALGIHFATWLASLELTSVAASVTLVATAPLMIAVYDAVRGRRPPVRTWVAIGMAIVGTAVIAFGDLGSDSGQEGDAPFGLPTGLWGDLLALIGAAAMAVYLVVGAGLRTTLSTAVYASRAYGGAAAALLVAAFAGGAALTGFDTTTWLAIAAMIAGPQLIGHTGLNHLLRQLGSLTVSLALLVEPLAAALLVWAVLGEVPPASAVIGAPLVIGGIALHLLGRRR